MTENLFPKKLNRREMIAAGLLTVAGLSTRLSATAAEAAPVTIGVLVTSTERSGVVAAAADDEEAVARHGKVRRDRGGHRRSLFAHQRRGVRHHTARAVSGLAVL